MKEIELPQWKRSSKVKISSLDDYDFIGIIRKSVKFVLVLCDDDDSVFKLSRNGNISLFCKGIEDYLRDMLKVSSIEKAFLFDTFKEACNWLCE